MRHNKFIEMLHSNLKEPTSDRSEESTEEPATHAIPETPLIAPTDLPTNYGGAD